MSIIATLDASVKEMLHSAGECWGEVKFECTPSRGASVWPFMRQILHTPYFPWYTKPGWLMPFFTGPYDATFYENLQGDFFAGFTVAITLIPQALSYANLAGLPPMVGLYSCILPIPLYILLGTNRQLGVGPVALISLLLGQLIGQYGIDSVADPQTAINFAAQACFATGLMEVTMGMFNLGNMIRFISHPVMSGFTTAAAMIIGLNQVRSAFGFPNIVPKVGAAGGVQYNYEVMEWYVQNWYGKDDNGNTYINPYSTSITFGIYIPLAALFVWKLYFKPSPEFKKTKLYVVYNLLVVMSTLLAMVISAKVAFDIRSERTDYHAKNLPIVGEVPAGLNIFKMPVFEHSFSTFFGDVLPLTIISFMESYSVAKKIAAQKNTLSDLNPSQELLALGLGNICNMFATGYPVSGSFSRSALYANSGCHSQLASFVTLLIVLVAVGALTKAFFFIPQAALAAVVMIAMLNLIDPMEFWHAWKLSKKDFFVMTLTFLVTLIFDTKVGLACGFVMSLLVLIQDLAFSSEAKPISMSMSFKGVEIIRLNSNLVFVSATRIKDTLINEIFASSDLQAVVIDFIDVKHADISGLIAMKEVVDYARKNSLLVFMVNISTEVGVLLSKCHIESDDIKSVEGLLHDSIMDACMACMVGSATKPGLDVEAGEEQSLLNTDSCTAQRGALTEEEKEEREDRNRRPQFWNTDYGVVGTTDQDGAPEDHAGLIQMAELTASKTE
ncbi:sulfate transporter family-domain-containing protein [Ochromonadaceae sp. CCMP2298]|nr:sulfate transporter family-domain-containing protein [Ochromonadaceae sp. CCMP2298]|eukprot:CAMPEP_0173195860 /NCGR_PEP_ID=MMETSP1141-20130122/15285_1 /TAXON_ID=483371 /ORGANISM="non described non described, Strain CCMP2298" /LENGTH=726 /DNA_ID=CAMNT_0014120427 /DNA_START=167 /DNA_END=2350 /DNA_ORIENTATION=-